MMDPHKKWFTLVEMLIVVVILGILLAAIVPRIIWAKDRAVDTARQAAVKDITTAFASYFAEDGYPLATNLPSNAFDFAVYLKAGGMVNIPTDPKKDVVTLFGVPTSGYVIAPVLRWGTRAFIVASRIEMPSMANWVEITTADFTGTVNLNTITFCNQFSNGTVNANYPTCTVKSWDWNKLRYVQKY